MAEVVTNTTQLSTFVLLRDLILTNATISGKFKERDFYEFEPNHKSRSFNGFPYFILSSPTTDTEFLTLDHTATDKEFVVEVTMVLDYVARDNFKTYADALVSVVEGGTSTLEGSGYYNHTINQTSAPRPIARDTKLVVEGTFAVAMTGFVNR